MFKTFFCSFEIVPVVLAEPEMEPGVPLEASGAQDRFFQEIEPLILNKIGGIDRVRRDFRKGAEF